MKAHALSRAAGDGRPAAPVRIVHLGLGNFFRAHQASYTDRAKDADQWGIAAFTGRRADLALALRRQGGLYTLVTRGSDGDRYDVVSSVSAACPAEDSCAWLDYLRRPEVAVVTLTVTESGYLRGADGRLDTTHAGVQGDVRTLQADRTAPVATVPARLLAGLIARRSAGIGRVAVVPCDNLQQNGAVVREVVREFAALVDPGLVDLIDATATFVTTMVDRITPETTAADRDGVLAATGLLDATPVVTEPFSEWVLSGEFPAGRPAWKEAGAMVVDDVAPFEQRKLWLLNGAHSLLAYAGSTRGHVTVADAVADPVCRGWLEQWWDEAGSHLPLPAEELSGYREALLIRFANSRIRHRLAQVAADGSQKVPIRVVPVLLAERAAGRLPPGATRMVAGWVCHLRGLGAPVHDTHAGAAVALASGPVREGVARVLGRLDPQLVGDESLVDAVTGQVEELSRP